MNSVDLLRLAALASRALLPKADIGRVEERILLRGLKGAAK